MPKNEIRRLDKGFSVIDLAATLTIATLFIGATLKGLWHFDLGTKGQTLAEFSHHSTMVYENNPVRDSEKDIENRVLNFDASIARGIEKSRNVSPGLSGAESPQILNGRGDALDANVIVCSRGVPGGLAISLDKSLDDGNPAMGRMLARPDVEVNAKDTTPSAVATGPATDIVLNKRYIVCYGI